jgi:hypothetical protein
MGASVIVERAPRQRVTTEQGQREASLVGDEARMVKRARKLPALLFNGESR